MLFLTVPGQFSRDSCYKKSEDGVWRCPQWSIHSLEEEERWRLACIWELTPRPGTAGGRAQRGRAVQLLGPGGCVAGQCPRARAKQPQIQTQPWDSEGTRTKVISYPLPSTKSVKKQAMLVPLALWLPVLSAPSLSQVCHHDVTCCTVTRAAGASLEATPMGPPVPGPGATPGCPCSTPYWRPDEEAGHRGPYPRVGTASPGARCMSTDSQACAPCQLP